MGKVTIFPGENSLKSLISDFNQNGNIDDLILVFEFAAKRDLSSSKELTDLDVYHLDFSSSEDFQKYSKFLFSISVENINTAIAVKNTNETIKTDGEFRELLEQMRKATKIRQDWIDKVDRNYSWFYPAYTLAPILTYVYEEDADPGIKLAEYLKHSYVNESNLCAFLESQEKPYVGQNEIPYKSDLYKLVLVVGQEFINRIIPSHKEVLREALINILAPHPSGAQAAQEVCTKQLIAILLTNEYFAAKWMLGYFLDIDNDARPVNEEQLALLMVLYDYQWKENNLREHINLLNDSENVDYLRSIDEDEFTEFVLNYNTVAFAAYLFVTSRGSFTSIESKNICKSFFENFRLNRLSHDGRCNVTVGLNIDLENLLEESGASFEDSCFDWPIIISRAYLDDPLHFGPDIEFNFYVQRYSALINKTIDEGSLELSNILFSLFIITHLTSSDGKLSNIPLIEKIANNLQNKMGWDKYSLPAISFVIEAFYDVSNDSYFSKNLRTEEVENYIFRFSKFLKKSERVVAREKKLLRLELLENPLVKKLGKESKGILESTETNHESVKDIPLSDWGGISLGYCRIIESELRRLFSSFSKNSWNFSGMISHLKKYEVLSDEEKSKLIKTGTKLHEDKKLLSALTRVNTLRNKFSHGEICDAVKFKLLRKELFEDGVFWKFIELL